MKKRAKLNKKEKALYEAILQELEDIGIDTELLTISMEKGPKVVIEGEVYSHKDNELIYQVLSDTLGIEEIENYTVIMAGIREESSVNGEDFENIEDLEDDSYGTEDIFESIEDGEPYIPPVSHVYTELSQNIKWKKKKNKAR